MSAVAALIGNGYSMAYNPALSVSSLETALRTTLTHGTDASAVTATLNRVAEANSGFEELLGPLDAVAAVLPNLMALLGTDTSLIDANAQRSLKISATLLRAVYRRGTAITLELIAERTKNDDPEGLRRIQNFIKALAEESGQDLLIGTVNYDGLLHAALLAPPRDRPARRPGHHGAGHHHRQSTGQGQRHRNVSNE
jgi:hypothetical protein